MNKKLLGLISMLLIAVLALAACGTSDDAGKKEDGAKGDTDSGKSISSLVC